MADNIDKKIEKELKSFNITLKKANEENEKIKQQFANNLKNGLLNNSNFYVVKKENFLIKFINKIKKILKYL